MSSKYTSFYFDPILLKLLPMLESFIEFNCFNLYLIGFETQISNSKSWLSHIFSLCNKGNRFFERV